jgi:hypothetical protein
MNRFLLPRIEPTAEQQAQLDFQNSSIENDKASWKNGTYLWECEHGVGEFGDCPCNFDHTRPEIFDAELQEYMAMCRTWLSVTS